MGARDAAFDAIGGACAAWGAKFMGVLGGWIGSCVESPF